MTKDETQELFDLDSEITEEEVEEANRLAKEVYEEEVKEFKSVIVDFFDAFEGHDDYKVFLTDFMLDSIHEQTDEDDINYYDYLFHEYLIDAYVAYSKSVLEDVKKGSKKKELKDIVESTKDLESISWKDVYDIVVRFNPNKRYAKFILGDK